MSAFDGGDDFVGVLGPDERLWRLVILDEVAVNGSLEIGDAIEDASLEAPLGEAGEEALDRIEPGCRCWGEWKTKRG